MRGEVQLGGFLSWEARVDLSNMRQPRTLLAARAIWLFEALEGSDIKAVLYSVVYGKLVVTAQYLVEVTSAPAELPEDALAYYPLQMVAVHGLQ